MPRSRKRLPAPHVLLGLAGHPTVKRLAQVRSGGDVLPHGGAMYGRKRGSPLMTLACSPAHTAHISDAPTNSAHSRTESGASVRRVAPSGVIAKRPSPSSRTRRDP